jgi:hypothetical protein
MARSMVKVGLLSGVILAVGSQLVACITMDFSGLMTAKCVGDSCDASVDEDGSNVLAIDEGPRPKDASVKAPSFDGGASRDAGTDGAGSLPSFDGGGDGSGFIVRPIPADGGPKADGGDAGFFDGGSGDAGNGDSGTSDGGTAPGGNGTVCNPTVASALYPQSCSMGGASQDVSLINNCTSETLDLYWIGFDCTTENLYGTFAPGEGWYGTSYVSHVWVWRNHATGVLVGSAVVQPANGTAVYTMP